MLVVELRFITGRFHANPWGRNVNEGVPEWPPSPYRLLRAVYDAWKRKRPEWPDSRVEPLLRKLASQSPLFHLPPARASHTRSFLNQNERDPAKKSLIFDAFVVILPDAPVLVGWPDLILDDKKLSDLAELLSVLNYIGRSESWIDAKIITGAVDYSWNCQPSGENHSDESSESVLVACPLLPHRYDSHPLRLKVRGKQVAAKYLSWLDALGWSTSELLDARRSEPPALQHVLYLRPAICFDSPPRRAASVRRRHINGVFYALESAVPAPVTATIEIAEQVRRKLMGVHRRLIGDPEAISERFTGKDSAGNPLKGHRHCFILPQDRDNDGWLDHLLVISREPLDWNELRTLYRLESLWQRAGKPDIRCTPIRSETFSEFAPPSARFVSATPFVTSRHYRKGRGHFFDWLVEEVRREATNHGLPQLTRLAPMPGPVVRGRLIQWRDFRRNRREEPIFPGYGFELEFAQPVARPFALGYGCHFGLGQFRPCE
jgi:CRISPR-associated protein Csb2